MQTFLPFADFTKTAKVLDWKRLGKQRVEGMQLINILTGNTTKKGWVNHPAAKMWIGYDNALKHYVNSMIKEWISRGYNNTMKLYEIDGEIIYPKWFGNDTFHKSHRSNLLRKDFDYYSKYFNDVDSTLEYFWPTKEGY